MKKTLIAALSSLLIAGYSMAVPTAGFTVTTVDGAFTDGTYSTLISAGSLAVLIWTLDDAYVTPVEGFATTRGSAFGSDYVLWTGALDIDGGFSGPQNCGVDFTSTDVGGASILDGWAYLMVFANGSPIVGTQYYVSPRITVDADMSGAPPPTPDNVDLTGARGSPAYFGEPGFSGTVVAVPEPSTVGLLLVGAGLVAFRRMRRG